MHDISKIVFSFFLFCLAFSVQNNNNLYVTSDSFSLDSEDQILILSKNVYIKSNVYSFRSDLVKYSLDKDIFNFYDDFSIIYKGQAIQGANLELNNKTKMLTANNVAMTFDKYFIKGKLLRTIKDEYLIEKAQVTPCDGDPPLIYISSGQMSIYPKLGFMVVFNSVFYIYNIPVFYLPAYFMGGRMYTRISEFIPEIGSNSAEGNYVKERIPYYINSSHSGSLFLAYLEKFGPKVGIDHYVILGSQNLLNISGYYNPSFLQWGIEYSYEFLQDSNETGYLFWYLFDKEKVDNNSLKITTKWYEKELIHNWFVDQKPRIGFHGLFRVDDNNLVKANYEYGHLKELDYSTGTEASSWRRQLELSLQSELRLSDLKVMNELAGIKSFYKNQSHQRVWDTVKFSFPYAVFNFTVGAELMLDYHGTSPFNHDLYDISDEDNLIYALKATFPYFIFEFDSKQKWSGDFFHRRYTIRLPFYKCMDFSFSYDDIKEQFSVVFKL